MPILLVGRGIPDRTHCMWSWCGRWSSKPTFVCRVSFVCWGSGFHIEAGQDGLCFLDSVSRIVPQMISIAGAGICLRCSAMHGVADGILAVLQRLEGFLKRRNQLLCVVFHSSVVWVKGSGFRHDVWICLRSLTDCPSSTPSAAGRGKPCQCAPCLGICSRH